MGYVVTLVGRELPQSLPLHREYSTKRFRLLFTKGIFFYINYNIRLFLFLLFSKVEVIHANDLDTLPAVYAASLFKRSRIVYDSHEYFTEVPELVGRKLTQSVWKMLEGFIFPRLQNVITVNASIASIYEKKYNVPVEVIRNVPFLADTKRIMSEKKSRSELGLPEDKKIIILQGAWINVDRGGEEAITMMKHLPGCFLLIVGGGDVYDDLKLLAQREGVHDAVRFFGRLPFTDLRQLTMNADLGISLDKGTNLNYLYSLPNKLFDYIHAGIPVIVSDMPEVASIVRNYDVGKVVQSHDPEVIAASVKDLLNNPELLLKYKKNCLFAREALCWETESNVLRKFY